MSERKTASAMPAEKLAEAGGNPSRRPWTAPRLDRLATSAAETGGAIRGDGVESFS